MVGAIVADGGAMERGTGVISHLTNLIEGFVGERLADGLCLMIEGRGREREIICCWRVQSNDCNWIEIGEKIEMGPEAGFGARKEEEREEEDVWDVLLSVIPI